MGRNRKKKSIFRSLFVPMIVVMVVQAILFYLAAVYGGIETSLSQNAVDILSGRMDNRASEIETLYRNRWTALDDCIATLDRQYAAYERAYGEQPFLSDVQHQIDFLEESGDVLISTLRFNQANGIFLIVNDVPEGEEPIGEGGAQKYGLCIRDMDQNSQYSGTSDLLLERAPSHIVDKLGCLLDSWWEAKYSFRDAADGSYYYAPLKAALSHPNSESMDLAYLSDVHQISDSDPRMISYSVPLLSEDGSVYAVLGVELSVNYLASLLPNTELAENEKGCYILALQTEDSDSYTPLVASGTLYNRCFGETASIKRGEATDMGGFTLTGRDDTELYAVETALEVYNNNSPFETERLVLLAVVESDSLFSYVSQIKSVLAIVAALSPLLGFVALAIISRHFSRPITTLARKASHVDNTASDYALEHIGITEIDQLVDSIEKLNQNVSRNSARTEFFSRMSHDMRTPMNAIIGFSSQEFLENADEATKDDYLNRIHESGTYLLGLINDVLDMTKIESSKTEIHPAAVSAAQLFDTSVSIIEKLAQRKNVTFTKHISLSPTLTLMADAQHINQIVMNLLSNAVKFTPEGGSVTLSAELLDTATLRVIVEDTGIGISDAFMEKLYTPFTQESNNHEGTGLGLSITKKLIDLMEGNITCHSEKGRGTGFTVTLPALVSETAQDSPATPAEKPSQVTDTSLLHGKRILVCEDNTINIRIITHLLERVGMQVEVAENGAEGVALFEGSPLGTYHAILMDIRMPVMDGLEAAKAIRSLPRKDARFIPIFAMTADAFAEDEQTSRNAGMNAHLSKPIDIDKLYRTLTEFLP